jgi:hypothetical protein
MTNRQAADRWRARKQASDSIAEEVIAGVCDFVHQSEADFRKPHRPHGFTRGNSPLRFGVIAKRYTVDCSSCSKEALHGVSWSMDVGGVHPRVDGGYFVGIRPDPTAGPFGDIAHVRFATGQ